MAVLSIEQIYEVARDAGFTPHQAVTWTAIAMAESGGRTSALNDRGEHSVGLWQINVASDVRQNSYGNLNDPAVNARAAYEISHQGTDMRPWTTTHDANKGTAHDYRQYLPKVENLIGVQGDDRGVSGYGAPLPEPLTGPEYDQIDSGAPLGGTALPITTAADRDQDGLTDEFERLVGSKSTMIDTDRDGLSDSHEALRSHTDPLSADTDADHLTDASELIAGSDAGRIPGVGGVVGTGPFAINVRSPGRDSDKDGIPDRIEQLVGLEIDSADSDRDSLQDAMEVSLGTDPTKADSDHDGLTDAFELRAQQNPLAATGSTTNTVAAWTYEGALAERTAAEQPPVEEPLTEEPGPIGDSEALATFLRSAREQAGDSYVYGATPALTNADPKAFDCSSLTQWAAHKAGIELPRIAEAQYMELKGSDNLIPVEEALKTPGALLFYFSEEPTGPLPAGQAHVAISLGDGRTIEAKGSSYGVGEFPAKGRFNYAGVIPGLSDGTSSVATSTDSPLGEQDSDFGMDTGALLTEAAADQPDLLPGAEPDDPDRDQDGLTDAFEKLVGSDFRKVDTDADGLTDGREAMITHTDPLSDDTDQDHLRDSHELATGTDPGQIPGIGGVQGTGRLAENVRVRHADADQDGISNRIEKILGTDVRSADTDADGLRDSMERSIGSNPLSADTDADGLTDGFEVHNRMNPLAVDQLGAGSPAADPAAPLPAEAPDTDSGPVFEPN